MSVETVYAVSREPSPSLEDRLLGHAQSKYESEMMTLVNRLGEVATFSLEQRRNLAFLIVGEDVPEAETRETLRRRYYSDDVLSDRPTVNMLDGGLGRQERP